MFEFLLQKLLYILALSSPLCRSPSEVPERLPPEPKPQKVCWIKHNSQLLGCGFFFFFSSSIDRGKDEARDLIFKMNKICHHFYLLITFGDSAAAYEWMYRYPTFFTSFCLCLGSLEPQGGPVLICAVMVQWHHLSATIPSVSPPDFLWLHWVAWTQALSSPKTAVAQTLLSCLSHTIQSKKDLIPSHLALFCLSRECSFCLRMPLLFLTITERALPSLQRM